MSGPIFASPVSEGIPTLVVRDLEKQDLPVLMELLSHLTKVEKLSEERLNELFEERIRCGIITKVVYDIGAQRIVGTASLVVERKFTRGGRCVGHVEDVVTEPEYRGRGVGSKLVRELCAVAKDLECYKIILDCSDDMVNFYSRYGFVKCENQMRIDLA